MVVLSKWWCCLNGGVVLVIEALPLLWGGGQNVHVLY